MKKILTQTILLLLLTAIVIPSSAITLTEPAPSATTTDEPKDNSATLDNQKVSEALKEFKNLSKHDRKERMKEAKKAMKQYKADKKAGKAGGDTNTLLLVIIAILLPPLAVFLHQGEINSKFWIDLILTLLFYLPGLIYALVVILSKS